MYGEHSMMRLNLDSSFDVARGKGFDLKQQRLASIYPMPKGMRQTNPSDILSNLCHQTRKESDEGLTVRINTCI